MHEKTAGTKKAPALDYGATAPRTLGLPHPVTGLTVTGRTVARGGEQGKVRSGSYRPDSDPISKSVPHFVESKQSHLPDKLSIFLRQVVAGG